MLKNLTVEDVKIESLDPKPEKVEKSLEFWETLFKSNRANLSNTIKRVLNRDISLYREILISLEHQSGRIRNIRFSDISKNHWLINYNDEYSISVSDHSNAQIILSDLIKFYNLPEKLPNGNKILRVEKFDQLMIYMIQFNPEYILELASHIFNNRNISRFGMSHYDPINSDEAKLVRKKLKTLLKSLK